MGISQGGYNSPNNLKMESPNLRMELCSGLFFTNGGSTNASTNITFNKPFSSVPTIFCGQMPNDTTIPYSDVCYYPFIYNVTTTGFSVKINSAGNLGTVGSPANLTMNFAAIGND